MALEVLKALDSVRTQLNHITTIIIARMGFFTDAYNIFCISTISKLLGCLYYTVTGVALVGPGIGGDYPISAIIMSEYSNKNIRGAFIAAVYAMQGVRIIFARLVPMMLSGIFLHFYPTASFKDDLVVSTQPEVD
ncbi:putative inorganic phosphate transporter 1-3 [Quercus suber]|uniref:Inorganic phosphate transporter 1-3 n=1 Tax=Quercus suber TaxID=58331 RepID=A0AAW0LX14_QUESU